LGVVTNLAQIAVGFDTNAAANPWFRFCKGLAEYRAGNLTAAGDCMRKVLERVNDIAILKSFGLSRRDITQIYLMQGIVIGLVGSVIGLILGKVAVEGLRRLPIRLEGLVKTEGLLMSEHLSQYVTAFMSAMIIVILAAVYPARRAATFDPVEVIRGAH
jgi:ABC-type lipoprotein release transport system permease subunit